MDVWTSFGSDGTMGRRTFFGGRVADERVVIEEWILGSDGGSTLVEAIGCSGDVEALGIHLSTLS